MSNETLSLPVSGGISLASLPAGSATGDVFQWDGMQWQIVANDNNNPLNLSGIVPPAVPAANTGVLYKQTGSDGLWWRTDIAAPIDVTLAAAATTDVPQGLNIFIVNPNIPAVGNNYNTIQAAITAAVATLPATVRPIVHIVSGVYAEPTLLISGNITIRGDSRESVFLNNTIISCASSCLIENLTCDGVAGPALIIDVTIPLSQNIIAKNCTFRNSGGLNPTINWGVGSALCRFSPANCSFSSGSTGFTVLRLAFTNSIIATDCSWVGILENSNPNNNACQLIRGTINGRISLVNPYLPASGVAPVALGTRLHVVEYRLYSDNDVPAITSTMDFTRVLSDKCDYLVNGVVATSAIALTGPSNQLVECGTTFSMHPNRSPVNVTRITVSDNNIIHEDSPSVGPQLGIYTVNPNIPQSYSNFHTIQAAITAVEAVMPTTGLDKKTIHITPGNYQENLTITKRVELIGVGAGQLGYYQGAEAGKVAIRGTVTLDSPCYLENISFEPGQAAVPNNNALVLGLWLTDIIGPVYNEADSVIVKDSTFVSGPGPGYLVTWTQDQTSRTAGKRAFLKMYNCKQDNANIFLHISNSNWAFLYDSTIVGGVYINPITSPTIGANAVLVAENSTIRSLMPGIPAIEINGTAGGGSQNAVNLLSCRVRCDDAAIAPIVSPLDNVGVYARHIEFHTSNANAISLTSAVGTTVTHRELYSAVSSLTPNISNAGITTVLPNIPENTATASQLNVYLVNRNEPTSDRNFHTIQAAINAANLDTVTNKIERSNTATAGTATTITLDAGANINSAHYNGMLIEITGGTGVGQRRYILGYGGGTLVAVVAAWTVIPDVTSTFTVYNMLNQPVVMVTPGDYTEDLTIGDVWLSAIDSTPTNYVNAVVRVLGQVTITSKTQLSNILFMRQFTIGTNNTPTIQLSPTCVPSVVITMKDCVVNGNTTIASLVSLIDLQNILGIRVNMIDCRVTNSTSASRSVIVSGSNTFSATRSVLVGFIIVNSSADASLQLADSSLTGTIRFENNYAGPASTLVAQIIRTQITNILAGSSGIICTGNYNHLVLEEVWFRINGITNPLSHSVNMTGLVNDLTYSGVFFGSLPGSWIGATQISITGTQYNYDAPQSGEDLNMFNVNLNRPRMGRNYHTIQAAVDSAIAEYEVNNLIRANTVVASGANTVTLDAGSSAVNSTYDAMRVHIASGTGTGQRRHIQSYDGATRIATLSGTWTTPPDATSGFRIINTLDTTKPVVQITNGDYTTTQVNATVPGILDLYSAVILRAGGYNTANNSETYVAKLNCQILVNSPSTIEHLVIYRSDNLPRVQLGPYNDWSDTERGFVMNDCSIECADATTPAALAWDVNHSIPVARSKRIGLIKTRLRNPANGSDNAVGLLVNFTNTALIENMYASNGRINLGSTVTNALQIYDSYWGGRIVVTGSPASLTNLVILRNVRLEAATVSTNPTIHVQGINTRVILSGVKIAALPGQTAAIGFDTGTGCTLEYDNLAFDRTSTYNNVTILPAAAIVTNSNTSQVGDDLNVFTVNLNRPRAGRNFHTIQAAVNAASLATAGNRCVLLSAGIFTENVTISSDGLKLIGITPQGSIGSREGSRIVGTVTLNAPNIELNSLIITSAIGSGTASVVITSNVSSASNQNVYIWNCSIGRDVTDVDTATPTILGTSIAPNRTTLKLSNTIVAGLGEATTNGGINMNMTRCVIDAIESGFELGEIISNLETGSHLFQGCRFQNTFTANKTVASVTWASFLNCIINNNSRNSAVPIFTFNDSTGGGTTTIVLVNNVISQARGASPAANWLINNNGLPFTVDIRNAGNNHRGLVANNVLTPISGAPPAGVTFTALPTM